MQLIWKKVNDIIIGNNTFTVEIVPSNEDTSNTGQWATLTNIVNNPESNEKLFFIDGRMGLGQGYNDFDWASYWSTESPYLSQHATSYHNEGDVGYLGQQYTSILGHQAVMEAHDTGFEYINTHNNNLFMRAAPLEPYWNIENESVYVDIPLFLDSIDYTDSIAQLRHIVTTGGNVTTWNYYNNALGDLGINPDAPFYNEDLTNIMVVRYIDFHEIQTEILIHLRFSLGYIEESEANLVSYIGAGQHLDTYNKQYAFHSYPAPVLDSPNYNFSLSVSGLSNLPSSVVANETTQGSFTVEANEEFNGTFKVYAFDYLDNLNDLNDMLQGSLDEQDAAQYGTLEYNTAPYAISAGQTVEVPITYTSTQSSSQTDSYSIVIMMTSLDPTAYEQHGENAQNQFNEMLNSSKMIYTDIPTIQTLALDEAKIDEYNPSSELIRKPTDIIFHLIEQELGYTEDVDFELLRDSREEHEKDIYQQNMDWNLDFSLFETINAKKLISEISSSSKLIVSLASDTLRFNTIKNTYNGDENIYKVFEYDVIKYNFTRTAIKDIITEIEVKYGYDIGLESFIKSTGKIQLNENYFKSGTAPQTQTDNYYGVKTNEDGTINHIDSHLIIENKYIQDDTTAINLAEHILAFRQNQHNIVDLTLPLKYFDLEVGDVIEFDKMILNKKVYGEKYVLNNIVEDMPVRGGQYILPLFMVTETNKSIKDVKVKAIQLHHMSKDFLNFKNTVFPLLNPIAQEEAMPIAGDITGDGFVNVLDVVSIVVRIVEGTDFTEQEIESGDITGDGFVNVLDVVSMVQRIVNE